VSSFGKIKSNKPKRGNTGLQINVTKLDEEDESSEESESINGHSDNEGEKAPKLKMKKKRTRTEPNTPVFK
jgi:hypothetical protein